MVRVLLIGCTNMSQKSLSVVVVGFVVVASPAWAGSYRSIDGGGNNISNPDWGSVDVQLLRLTSPGYDGGIGVPRGGNPSSLPSARAISNAVAAQSGLVRNSVDASDWLWQWGQFLDHDLDLTEPAAPAEPFNVSVPMGDPFFDPFNTGSQEIGLNRSAFDTSTGTGSSNPRQQINQITAYIDASNLYGSDAVRAGVLRDPGGGGRLLMPGGLLQFNNTGLPNAGGTDNSLYLSGDVRANEQIGLTATHTLFSREHNRLAASLEQRLQENDAVLVAKRDAAIDEMGNGVDNDDDFIYQSVRKVVGAQMQKITYEEFLPVLLGSQFAAYSGYDDTVNTGISNEFSTAAYRVGHTMLSPTLLRLNNDGTEAPEGNIALRDAFFAPDEITDHGIDSLLKGLASQKSQAVDTLLVDDVRNFLFGPPGSGGFDLASLNIQRGREHGLASYNDVRNSLGLATASTSFLDMTGGDVDLANALAGVFDSVDDVDLWIGGLAETHVNGGVAGETFSAIIGDQFLRLRDGDRFFYQNDLEHLRVLDPDFESTLLSDIILRNTVLTNLQANVFLVVPEPSGLLVMLGATPIFFLRAARRRFRSYQLVEA